MMLDLVVQADRIVEEILDELGTERGLDAVE